MQKKGRSGHEMLVVVDFSIGTKINMCFFSSYNIYIYIYLFIYLYIITATSPPSMKRNLLHYVLFLYHQYFDDLQQTLQKDCWRVFATWPTVFGYLVVYFFFGGGVGLVSLFLRLKHDLFKASVCSLFWHFIWQHFIWFIWSKPHWYVHVWSFLTELCRESLPNSCVPGWYYSEYSSYLAFKSLYFMFE